MQSRDEDEKGAIISILRETLQGTCPYLTNVVTFYDVMVSWVDKGRLVDDFSNILTSSPYNTLADKLMKCGTDE